MDLILQPIAPQCAVSGQPFADGERVVSVLGRNDAGEVLRLDVAAAREAEMTPLPFVLCRWIHPFKPREKQENPERNLKLGAEALFVTLCDPHAEPNPTNTPLIQFLALMLERKKVLRPKGLTADRARRVFEHVKSKQLYEVPAGELTAEFFVKVQEQLGVLVGEPKKKADPAVAGPVAAPGAPATPAPTATPAAEPAATPAASP